MDPGSGPPSASWDSASRDRASPGSTVKKSIFRAKSRGVDPSDLRATERALKISGKAHRPRGEVRGAGDEARAPELARQAKSNFQASSTPCPSSREEDRMSRPRARGIESIHSAPARKDQLFWMDSPPSAIRTAPLMYEEAGRTRPSVAWATSSGSPYRPIGTRRRANFCFASSGILSVMPVRIGPGQTQL